MCFVLNDLFRQVFKFAKRNKRFGKRELDVYYTVEFRKSNAKGLSWISNSFYCKYITIIYAFIVVEVNDYHPEQHYARPIAFR